MILRFIAFVGATFIGLLVLLAFSAGVAYMIEHWRQFEKTEFAFLNAKEWLFCTIAALFLTWMLWVSTRDTKG